LVPNQTFTQTSLPVVGGRLVQVSSTSPAGTTAPNAGAGLFGVMGSTVSVPLPPSHFSALV
jgi:hypothetical protein